jgi:hypothetical protein
MSRLRIRLASMPIVMFTTFADSHLKNAALAVGVQAVFDKTDAIGQDGDLNDHFRALEEWTRERFGQIEEIEYRWSGQVLEPDDYLAFIGRNPGDQNVYIATGDSGMDTHYRSARNVQHDGGWRAFVDGNLTATFR